MYINRFSKLSKRDVTWSSFSMGCAPAAGLLWPLLSTGEMLGGPFPSGWNMVELALICLPLLIFPPVGMGKFAPKINDQYQPKPFLFSSEMYFSNPHSFPWKLFCCFHVANLPHLRSLQNLCSLREAFSILPHPALPNPALPNPALVFEVARWERVKWQLLGHMQIISK